jgi:hypothetical protein
MDSSHPPDSLASTLAAWRVTPPRDPRFRAAVHARLGQASLPWTVYARRHVAVVGGALALALVVGALIGRESARSRVAAESAQLAAAYVQGLDARSMTTP